MAKKDEIQYVYDEQKGALDPFDPDYFHKVAALSLRDVLTNAAKQAIDEGVEDRKALSLVTGAMIEYEEYSKSLPRVIFDFAGCLVALKKESSNGKDERKMR